MEKDKKAKRQRNRAFIIRNSKSMPLLRAADTGEESSRWLFESGESFHGESDGEVFHFTDQRIGRRLKLPLDCVELEFEEEELQ